MKARLVYTTKCNRACEGCCNESIDWDVVPSASTIDDLTHYNEVIITGGEPCLDLAPMLRLAHALKNAGKRTILQTAYYPKESSLRHLIFDWFDGITYTLHDDMTIEDYIRILYMRDDFLLRNHKTSIYLNVDERVPNCTWELLQSLPFEQIRKMEWKDDCPLPEGEVLVWWKR